jgi:para-nitrobenzyl esterase
MCSGCGGASTLTALTGPPVDVAIDAGHLRGVVVDSVAVFRGVPYAAPPVDLLRWRPPQPVKPWSDVRVANAYGNDCMQNRLPFDSAPSDQPKSEDCLVLNVWAHAAKPFSALPVMVWIHGGGFVQGSGASLVYDAVHLGQRGVVVVTFNYRLGRFGFFAHPALMREAGNEPFGNYGLMDQIALLKWVRRNIAAFGGDPGNVTLWGESAGGASVNALLVCPAAQGLFHKAIIESGGGRDDWALLSQERRGKASAVATAKAFAEEAGVKADDAAALRAIPASKVLGWLSMINQQAETFSGAIVDGALVPTDVIRAFAQGKQARVPYLIGSNNYELTLLPMIGRFTKTALEAFGAARAEVTKIYDPDGGRAELDKYLINDLFFAEPARFFARTMAQSGSPAWLYRFSYVPEAKRAKQAGATHASEVPFVFDTIGAAYAEATDQDRQTARELSDYWISFARSGDPNGGDRPVWPGYSPQTNDLLEFTSLGPVARKNLDKQRLDYLQTRWEAR